MDVCKTTLVKEANEKMSYYLTKNFLKSNKPSNLISEHLVDVSLSRKKPKE